MKLLNNELEQTISNTVQALMRDERIAMYKKIKQLIEYDETLAMLWEQQKQIQKELVHAKTYKLTNQKQELELVLSEIEKQLQTHPLMEAYNAAYVQVVDIQNEIEEIVFGE